MGEWRWGETVEWRLGEILETKPVVKKNHMKETEKKKVQTGERGNPTFKLLCLLFLWPFWAQFLGVSKLFHFRPPGAVSRWPAASRCCLWSLSELTLEGENVVLLAARKVGA